MHFSATISIGQIINLLTLVGLAWGAWAKLGKPFLLRMQEHDIMWEDISIRKGWPFRIRHGRNGHAMREEEEITV